MYLVSQFSMQATRVIALFLYFPYKIVENEKKKKQVKQKFYKSGMNKLRSSMLQCTLSVGLWIIVAHRRQIIADKKYKRFLNAIFINCLRQNCRGVT